MTGYLTRARAAIAAAVVAPLAAAAVLLPFRSSWSNYGRFMMRPKPGSRPSLQAPLVAVTLADQAGRALAARTPASSGG